MLKDRFTIQYSDGSFGGYQPSKAVCIGRNYAKHATELNNPLPKKPILFLKTPNTFVSMSPGFGIPVDCGACHHELEIYLLIRQRLTFKSFSTLTLNDCIAAVGLALDLTLRDRQNELKQRSEPWTLAKAFDGACPLSTCVEFEQCSSWQSWGLSFEVNGDLRQSGKVCDMLWCIPALLEIIVQDITLEPGDLVLTGTPEGVQPLQVGDHFRATFLHEDEPKVISAGKVFSN